MKKYLDVEFSGFRAEYNPDETKKDETIPKYISHLEQKLAIAVEALEQVEAYLNWNEDELSGDDLIGDGKKTESFKNRIKIINEALAKIRGMG